MIITTAQRITVDREVLAVAQSTGAGIAAIEVRITEGEAGNIFLNLFHQDPVDPTLYSLLATQLRPDGREPWDKEFDWEPIKDWDGTVDPF